MVRVQIPVNTPVDDEDDGEDSGDKVGIMSDSDGESEVDDDIRDPDWDEVKNKDSEDETTYEPLKLSHLPKNGVTINIGPARPKRQPRRRGKKGAHDSDEDEEEADVGEEIVKKKRRKGVDLNEMVRKTINRVKITEQLMKHKLSLLLYLARGLRLVKIINCSIVKGLSLSITEHNFKIRGKKLSDKQWLETFLEQFGAIIQISSDDEKRAKHYQQSFMINLLDCFATLEATSLIELVVLFVACLKALKPDLPVRIVNVLRPITLRADIIPKPPSPINGEIVDLTEENQSKKEKKPQVIDLTTEVAEKFDFWVEVYLQSEKRWCCADLCNLKVDEPRVLVELSQPFNYLVSYDVDRWCVKPAEKYYCENWYTPGFRKGRCEDKWWDSVLGALGPAKKTAKDQADDCKTEELLVKQDMPTSDNGFRNHPLYVLQKHLLKFQGIYPPEVIPVGFFKDQPIYPRDCVRTLRSRETWLRQARTVKIGETPYKIVKARPKRDKYSGELIRDLPLELFGEWQTQDYEPPEAKNGKVPRNCYGNVDMYQECMLPKGCVWLKLAGLPRVANKLGIDCAAAVVGFDNHCGSYGAHPVVDGFIVCQEFAETLQMAWEEEQVNGRKREEEKRQKRIWDNWRRLIKAIQIREKLRVKYKNS